MKFARFHSIATSALLLCLATALALPAQDATQHIIPNSKMGFVSTAPDLGPADTSQEITIYMWLQLHNENTLRNLVEEEYDVASPNY